MLVKVKCEGCGNEDLTYRETDYGTFYCNKCDEVCDVDIEEITKHTKRLMKGRYKIILVINKDGARVLQEKCNQEIDLDKCIIEVGQPLFIVYKDGLHFKHENVLNVEPFEEYGLRVTTTKKTWFIYA